MQAQQSQLAETSSTILVVDDEVPITRLCKALLEESGFTVLEADGGSDAIKLCTQHRGPTDLLLADLVLPPPGFSAGIHCQPVPAPERHDLVVHASRIRSGFRIILMSGNPDKELESHGISLLIFIVRESPLVKPQWALMGLYHNVTRLPTKGP